jgi:sulfane dehydrogenase subunit SoxC
VAGNGLVDRRAFLRGGAAMAAAMTGYGVVKSAAAEPLTDDPWSLGPGAVTRPYEQRSRFEEKVARTLTNPKGETRVQNARTPLHLLNGTITPAGQHFVVAQSGAPDIDPERHRLVIHGLVKRPLVFTLEALARYPMVTRITFLECGGNGAPLFSAQPIQANLQALHGSCPAPNGPACCSPRCWRKPASIRGRNG